MSHSALLKVLLAVLLGVLAGFFLPTEVWGVSLVGMYNLLGKLFLQALMLIVIPLVASSLISGVLRLGADRALGRLGRRIALSFVGAMAAAVALGILAVFLWPSEPLTQEPSNSLNLLAGKGDFFSQVELLLYRVVPSNIFAAAAQGEILAIIFFSVFFGVATAQLSELLRGHLRAFFEAIFLTLLRMTQLVMRFLPLGVFGLIAKATATMGGAGAAAVGWFSLAVLMALALYVCIFLPLALRLLANVNPWKHIKAMSPALVTAFSTSSSAATLPVALECLEKEVGISNRISSLVTPLGITVNLCGSALYAGAVVTFMAQLNGLVLDWSSLGLIYFVTLMTSFGMAGVPSASLIAIVFILQTLQISNEHLALVMAIERVADMVRTAVNVFATSCCAVVVASWEGERLLI